MNPSSQKSLKGIKIFFKVMYLFLIVIFCINTIVQGINLFSNKELINQLSVMYVVPQPNMKINIGGNALQPQMLIGCGAIIINKIPVVMKINNTLAMLIGLFLYILVLRILRSIIQSIAENDLFSMLNAQRLKKIGYLLLFNLIIIYSITIFNSLTIQKFDTFSLGALTGMMIGKASGHVIAIAFTFFIATVFKIGVNIQEENQSIV